MVDLTITAKGEELVLRVNKITSVRATTGTGRLVPIKRGLIVRGFGGARTIRMREDATNRMVARGSGKAKPVAGTGGKVTVTAWIKDGRLYVQARSTRHFRGRTRSGGPRTTITVKTNTRGLLSRVK